MRSQGWVEACLFLGIHSMSTCHKYLDMEDLWVRFAILFSVRVINQLHAHSRRRMGLRRAHWHTPRQKQSSPCLMLRAEGALQGSS